MAEQSDDVRAQSSPPPPAQPLPVVPPHVGRDLGLYVLARFAIVAVVAVVLTVVNVPLLISIAVGLVVGVPLSMVLLKGWHQRVAAGLAARGMVRRAARDKLRAELRDGGRAGGTSPDAN